MASKVFRVKLNQREGYYRTVTRMTAQGVEREARRLYPRSDVRVVSVSISPAVVASVHAALLSGTGCFAVLAAEAEAK